MAWPSLCREASQTGTGGADCAKDAVFYPPQMNTVSPAFYGIKSLYMANSLNTDFPALNLTSK